MLLKKSLRLFYKFVKGLWYDALLHAGYLPNLKFYSV